MDSLFESTEVGLTKKQVVYWPHALVISGVLAGLFWYVFSASGSPWQPSMWRHPLGTDEFGRDILFSSLCAAGFSLGKGIVISFLTLGLALFLAEGITYSKWRGSGVLIRGAATIVESLPSVLWVMIVLIVLREPRLVVVGAAFALVSLPTASHVIAGELNRLRLMPFVEAARQLGAGEIRLILAYLLPNAKAVLIPYSMQILGTAIAIEGAIGVIGLGNRSDLDMGTFLLRGKENFILHPQILLCSVILYAAIYSYLLFVGRQIQAREG